MEQQLHLQLNRIGFYRREGNQRTIVHETSASRKTPTTILPGRYANSADYRMIATTWQSWFDTALTRKTLYTPHACATAPCSSPPLNSARLLSISDIFLRMTMTIVSRFLRFTSIAFRRDSKFVVTIPL